MNSITKIGKAFLTKRFSKKIEFMKEFNQNWITKLIFSKSIFDIENFKLNPNDVYRDYKIWSGDIGFFTIELKKDQTMLQGIVKKLNKQQKDDSPSHLIVTEQIKNEGIIPELTFTHTIYRLTDYQESLINNDYLFPAWSKRENKLREKFELERKKEDEEFERECKERDEEYEKSREEDLERYWKELNERQDDERRLEESDQNDWTEL